MTSVQTWMDIEIPVGTAYGLWSRYEDFPRFMEGVAEVRQLTGNRLHWVAQVAGLRREWIAEITEQVPERMIAWRSVEGALNAGMVTFEPLDERRTRVSLSLEFQPEGALETIGDLIGVVSRRIEGDLARFKRFAEERAGRRA